MKYLLRHISADTQELLAALLLVFAFAAVYGGYRYEVLRNEALDRETEVAVLESSLALLDMRLAVSRRETAELASILRTEQEKLRALGEEAEELSETVETFEKLSKLDRELLQKYSKVFFLNEHYEPSGLVAIPLENIYHEDEPERVHGEVWPFLEELLEEAAEDDVVLWVLSAYRSFDEQSQLKGEYSITYGAGANTFSADQGYSEHQLGTTVDFTTQGLGGGLTGFENTPAYEWLLENAHRYGFTLSYPENNNYYIFEPWHWRFVGEDLARHLHRSDLNFYDMDQREIDTYLLEIFD